MTNLPPKIPDTDEDVSRALDLLDRRVAGPLLKADRSVLRELLGKYPTPAQANAWRQAMRRRVDAANCAKAVEEV